MNADLMLVKMNADAYTTLVIEYGIAVLIFGFAIYGVGTALEEMIDKIVTTFKEIAERADALEAQEEAEDTERQAAMEQLEAEAQEQALLEAAMEAPVKTCEFRQQLSNLLRSLDEKDQVINDLTRVVNSHSRSLSFIRHKVDQQDQVNTELKQQLHNTETEIGSLFRDVENDVYQEVINVSNKVRELGLIVTEATVKKESTVKKEATVKKVPLIDLTMESDESDTESDLDTVSSYSSESYCSSESSPSYNESSCSFDSDFSDESKEEKKKEYASKYYADHRTEILEKQRAPVKCPHCAKCVAKASLPAHMKAAVCKRSRL
jgi:hypothetical protein